MRFIETNMRMIEMKKKGFTLAELLIVVAIIAVLVAVALPTFTSQLEKSREAADLSNIRTGYAEVVCDALTEGSAYTQANPYVVNLVQKQDGWLPGSTAQTVLEGLGKVTGTPQAGGTCEIFFSTSDNKCEFFFKGSKPAAVRTSYSESLEDCQAHANDFAQVIDYFMNKSTDTTLGVNIRKRGTNGLPDDGKVAVGDQRVTVLYYGTSDGQIQALIREPMKNLGYTDAEINGMLNSYSGIFLDGDGKLIAYQLTSSGGKNKLYMADGTFVQDIGGCSENRQTVAEYIVAHGGTS